MGEFIRTERRYCGCVEATLTHFVYKQLNGDIISCCAICSKITIIGNWRKTK